MNMASEAIKNLILHGVVPIDDELGRGSYGRVFTVKYCGLVCAAKEIHSILIDSEKKQAFKDDFVRECLNCSNIRHPNIVLFMGVYYAAEQPDIPTMVMELMYTSLTSFVQSSRSNITLKTKISILNDVSLGLSYLHLRRPPVIHRDLSSNNIMLTDLLVAKIGDLGVAKVVHAESQTTKRKLTTAPGTVDFMPPEALEEDPTYDTPVDVFSFAGISLHLLCEEWPSPVSSKKRDPNTNTLYALTEVERRQRFLDKITGKATTLKQMITKCLDDNPNARPAIQEISEIIAPLKEKDSQHSIKRNASQSSVSFSETSGDSANSKCSSANTNTEEHFFTAQSPDLLVQNSSATTTTTNDPVTTCTLDKTFPQIQTSQQHNQSVESQNVAQNLRHQPEASDVDQSIVIQKYQQQPFAAMQNTSQLLEQPHNILISHQQDVQHIQTETIQQDCQHITLATVSEKSNESAINECTLITTDEQSAQSSDLANQATTRVPITIYTADEMVLQASGEQHQSAESQNFVQSLYPQPETQNLTQNQQQPSVAMQKSNSQNMLKISEQPHSAVRGHQHYVQQQNQANKKQSDHQHASMYYKFSVILIGESAVGKSSIVQRYCDNIFTTQVTTIGVDTRIKKFEIDNNFIEFAFWDTGGQERFHAITASYYRRKDAILIVFDVTRKCTFRQLPKWIQQARTYSDAYTVIIGNKSDYQNREVSIEEATSFALQYGMPYFESSAKNDNVEKIFIHLVQRLTCVLPGTPMQKMETAATQAYAVRSRTLSQSEKIILGNNTNPKPTSNRCCIKKLAS